MSKVLVLGSGGREHALGWSIAQDPEVKEVLYAKGNTGTDEDEKCRNLEIDGTKKEIFPALADIVEKEGITDIVVGPEQPLADGIVDFFIKRGFNRIFGPTSAASALEADKFYSYRIMGALGIPQAKSILCSTTEYAEDAIRSIVTSGGVVIKARGLTAGKGVYVCDSRDEALARLKEHAKSYGPEVQISERLFGEEFSVFGISDGERVVPIEASVQDHKRLLDGDKGPNTGGMGAYCPASHVANAELVRDIAENFMTPVVEHMKKEGSEYKGFLYAAVIITEKGPKILEFNCRFGDPEAQPAVMMFKNGLYQPISAALEGRLDKVNIEFNPGAACCVVMASNGYPDSKIAGYVKGLPIGGLEEVSELPGVMVFHAGTAMKDGKVVIAGGRVLGVTAYHERGIESAQMAAYIAVNIINRATMELNNQTAFIYRNDIANRAVRK